MCTTSLLGLPPLAMVLGIAWTPFAGFLLTMVVMVLVFFVAVLRAGGVVAPAASVAGGLLAMAGNMFVLDTVVQLGGEHADGISVSEAPKHPRATVFHFVDGEPRIALTGTYRTYFDHQHYHYKAAPLVGAGWTPAAPVPAWVACEADGYEDDWRKPWRSATPVRRQELANDREAVADAEKKFGLKSDPRAPILRWTDAPEPNPDLPRDCAAALVLALAAFLAALVVEKLLAARRGRAA